MTKLKMLLASALIAKADPLIPDVLYSRDLGCGECVAGGYNFCWKASTPASVLIDSVFPTYDGSNDRTEQVCCKSGDDRENCNEIADGNQSQTSQWLCSSSYSDPIYALHVCPFRRSACGTASKISFYDTQDDGAIHIRDLPKGEACVYNIEAVCGAPSFNAGNSTDIEVYYLEWQQDSVKKSTIQSQRPSNSIEMKTASPLMGMPSRDVDFTGE